MIVRLWTSTGDRFGLRCDGDGGRLADVHGRNQSSVSTRKSALLAKGAAA